MQPQRTPTHIIGRYFVMDLATSEITRRQVEDPVTDEVVENPEVEEVVNDPQAAEMDDDDPLAKFARVVDAAFAKPFLPVPENREPPKLAPVRSEQPAPVGEEGNIYFWSNWLDCAAQHGDI